MSPPEAHLRRPSQGAGLPRVQITRLQPSISFDARNYAARRGRQDMIKSTRQEIAVRGVLAPLRHYTDAVRFGDLLFVSGVIPLDENGRLMGGDDAAAQTPQVLLNIKKSWTLPARHLPTC